MQRALIGLKSTVFALARGVKDYERITPLRGLADREETVFNFGISSIGHHQSGRVRKYILNLRDRHAMLLAFRAVRLIPKESGERDLKHALNGV